MTTSSPSSSHSCARFWRRLHGLHVAGPGGIRAVFVIAFPMIVSSATELIMMTTDRLFLAHLGPEYMSANASGGMMAFTTMTFFLGVIGYTTALVAQHYGAGQKDRCALVVHQGMLVGVAGYPLVLSLIPLALWLLSKAGHAPLQQVLERQYFTILSVGCIAGFLATPIRGFFTGIGKTSVIMVASLVAMVVNVAGNYVLVFGKLGFPALDIRGAAYGTVLGNVSSLLVLLWVYVGARYRREYRIVQALRFDRGEAMRLLRFGTPSGVEFLLNMAAFNLFVQLFHGYGKDAAAAMTITLQWDMVSFFPLLGISMATTSLVGRFMGARTPEIAEHAAYSGVKVAAAYAGILALVYVMFPAPLVRVFVPASQAAAFAPVLPLAKMMLRMTGLYVFSDAIAIVFGGALRGAGDTHWSMRVSVVMHWGMALWGYVMIRQTSASPMVVWIGFVGVVVAMGVIYYLRFRNGKWKSIQVLASEVVEKSAVAAIPAEHPEQVVE